MNKPAILFALLLFHFALNAQTEDNILNAIEEMQTEASDAENLTLAVEEFLSQPLKKYNINTATHEQLLILGLDNFQIFCLENYILRTGQILSLNELKFINGFDEKTVDRISLYLYAEREAEKHSLNVDSIAKYAKQDIRFQMVKNLKTPYGFVRTDGKGFKGDNYASTLRYRFRYYDRLEIALVGDKDYGEPWYYKNKTYGYDHYNFSITLRHLGKHISQLTVGDYRLNIGEGLAVKQSFSLGLFSQAGIKHSNSFVTPFSSSSEYNYNKGAAVKWTFGRFDLLTFASYTPLDYNLRSIVQTGYHRTQTEIDNKNSNSIAMGGGTLQYLYRGVNLGFTAMVYGFKDSLRLASGNYHKYDFEGKTNRVFAFNGSYAYRNALFFFESAMSANNAAAFLAGIQMGLGYKSSLSVVYRNYDKKYHNFYANAVGNHSPNRNERGVYADFHRYVSSRFSYSAGFDWYYYPFMAYRAGKPSYGAKAKAQLDFKLTQRQQSNIYFRFLNHQYNSSVHKQPQQLADNAVCQLQLRHKVSLTPSLTAVARAGYSRSFTEQSRKNQGWFAFTEFIYRNAAVPLSFNVRYTFFHTDDYDNRFYVYEYSLPLNYSSAVLQGKGHKLYVLAGYKIKDRAELHLRYTMTRYINNGGSISSGNMLHYIGMQVRYTFA